VLPYFGQKRNGRTNFGIESKRGRKEEEMEEISTEIPSSMPSTSDQRGPAGSITASGSTSSRWHTTVLYIIIT
jgi:hypothetical protein